MPYANVQHTGDGRLSSSFDYRNLPDFVVKDKARNASSVSGLLPQDAAKIIRIIIIARISPRFSYKMEKRGGEKGCLRSPRDSEDSEKSEKSEEKAEDSEKAEGGIRGLGIL